MNILFHCAVGNSSVQPYRWSPISEFFTDLANSFSKLGHNCLLYVHPDANRGIFKNKIVATDIAEIDFKPDVVFTWNGISPGDKELIDLYKHAKFVFCELGFFDHYKTCYFDLAGTNYKSMNLIDNINIEFNEKNFNELVSKYIKPRLYKEKYIFVPFQDENDTQITELSPFKTMQKLLDYVCNLYKYQKDIKVLYKQHPKKRANINCPENAIEVYEDVHHYLPYAENVVGINSTVLFETLLYHQRLITIGIGLPSRRFNSELERKKFILHCLNKQLYFTELSNVEIIKNSWIYKKLNKEE